MDLKIFDNKNEKFGKFYTTHMGLSVSEHSRDRWHKGFGSVSVQIGVLYSAVGVLDLDDDVSKSFRSKSSSKFMYGTFIFDE